jgi:hypothetical protein
MLSEGHGGQHRAQQWEGPSEWRLGAVASLRQFQWGQRQLAALEESVVSPDEIALRRQAGEVCPATKLETIGYTDGTTRERLWHCNQLIGHEGPHKGTEPGESTTNQMVFDKLEWTS